MQYNRNLILITFAQVFSFTAAPVTIFLSGIIGSQLTSIKVLSTLPTSMMIVGTALFTIFASKIMSHIGRQKGFILACILTSLSALIAAYAIYIDSFYLYCITCFTIGNGLAFTHQYRFAAAESVDKDMIPRAISIIMLAGILSAIIGPNVAIFFKDIIEGYTFVGSYLALSVLTTIPIFALFFFKQAAPNQKKVIVPGRSYRELLKVPRFTQSIVVAAMAYAIMSFLMTATPISMHTIDGHSVAATGYVIQSHIVAMFLPSLLTGKLIKRFGHSSVIYAGVLFLFLTMLMSLFEHTYINYLISLISLGLGWNFLFITSTSLLVVSYKEHERFKAQGFNDIMVFSMQATASLSAGFVLSLLGWQIMNIICIPFLFLVIYMTYTADQYERKLKVNS